MTRFSPDMSGSGSCSQIICHCESRFIGKESLTLYNHNRLPGSFASRNDIFFVIPAERLCRNRAKCHSESRFIGMRNLNMLSLLSIKISRSARNDKKGDCDTVPKAGIQENTLDAGSSLPRTGYGVRHDKVRRFFCRVNKERSFR